MAQITEVKAREILDSRGLPTIAASVHLDDGSIGSAAVPSGASTGAHEALELRDQDSARYLGKGVLSAIHNVNKIIAPQIIGLRIEDMHKIDEAVSVVWWPHASVKAISSSTNSMGLYSILKDFKFNIHILLLILMIYLYNFEVSLSLYCYFHLYQFYL